MTKQTKFLMLVFTIALGLSVQPSKADVTGCANGIFGVVAKLVLVDPLDAVVVRRKANGKEARIHVDEFLCAGESVRAPKEGPIERIVLYHAGHAVALFPGQSFENKGGITAYGSRALSFLTDLVEQLGYLGTPPEVFVETVSRGSETSAALKDVEAVAFIGGDVPLQKVTSDVGPLVAWKNGEPPFACIAQSSRGIQIWGGSPKSPKPLCKFEGDLSTATRLIVRDERQNSLNWNLAIVDWSEVPRPAWIAPHAPSYSAADQTAWAAWILKHAGAEWRLQSLAMLDNRAAELFIAGYLRDSILAGKTDSITTDATRN